MQISDLLGKYGQNTVPVTAQEQAVKTGTQQLTGTLSSLQTGNVFEGTVTDISDGQVLPGGCDAGEKRKLEYRIWQ